MDPNDKLENSTKEPEQVAAPETEPAVQDPPAPGTAPDIDEMSDKDFAAWDQAQAAKEDEGDASVGQDGKEKAVDNAVEQAKPATEEPKKEDAPESPSPEALARMRESAKLVEEWEKDPEGFLARRPDVASRMEAARRANAEREASAKRPGWAYVDPHALELPNNPKAWGAWAGWKVAEIKRGVEEGRVPVEEYQAVLSALSRDQGHARGQWETRQNMEREAASGQMRQAFIEFADGLRKENPKTTDDEIRKEVEAVTAFARAFRPTPVMMRRLMNYDKEIAAAEARGEQRGRQALLKDMDKAGKAPVAASSGSSAGPGAGTLLAKWQTAETSEAKSEFLDGLTDKQFKALEKQAKEAGVKL